MNLDQLVLYGVNSARDVNSFPFLSYWIVIWNCCLCKERIRTVYWVSLNDNEYYDIRYPVFIGIDDYNALYDYSAFEYRNQP